MDVGLLGSALWISVWLEQKFLHESGDYGERKTGESKQPLDSFLSNP
jgi:hypothetical protein